MKIVHVPTEIAGQMQAMVNGLRLAGHESNGFNWFLSYLNYSGEINITDAYELVRIVDPIARYADVIHFHNGNSFLANNIDLPLLYASGKPMVMHHWGNDVRTRKITSLLNPYPIPASYFTDERIHQNLMLTSKYIKHAIVQDYELYPHVSDYYEHVHVLPLVCKHEDIPFAYPSKTNTNPLIIHAPTNRDFKGSEHVERAISELKMTKRFEYRAIEKMSHTQAMKTYLTSDIIVDQLLCGTYGMLSVEAMAMGKVVVAFVRNDVRAKFPPELPIVVANPDNISAVLATLIDQPEARHNLGIAGRHYVEKYHSLKSITPKLLDIYNSAKGGE